MTKSYAAAGARRLLLGASAITITLAFTGGAWAQSAGDSDEIESVVVTGYRESLTSAVNAKRRENAVVDVIKSEDIAAFPDLNLAESLQRIPGVTITRVAGEGREISVRGLGPQYSTVRLNGMTALATSGSSDSGGASGTGGGTNRSRGFDFNIFASDLFNNITVRKSMSANVEEGSLGASVDLNTPHPFDYSEPTLVTSVKAGYNDMSGHVDPRLAVLASHNWLGDKLGTLVSIAYGERHVLEEGYATTRWDTAASQGGLCSPVGYNKLNPTSTATLCGAGGPARLPNTADNNTAYTLASATNSFLPRIPAYQSFSETEKRLGVTAAVQYRPAENTLITFDAMFARLDQNRNEQALQALGMSRNLAAHGKPEMTVLAYTANSEGDLTSATFNNVDLRTQSRIVDEGTLYQQYTAALEQSFGKLLMNARVGISTSRFETPNDTNVTFDSANVQNYKIDYTQNEHTPLITFGADPTLPTSWTAINGTSEVRLRPGYVNNKFKVAKLDFEYPLNDSLAVKFGGDYRDYTYNSVEYRRASETVSETLTAGELASTSYVFSGLGHGLDMPSGSITSWLVPDIAKYAALKNIYCNCGIYSVSAETNSSARGNTNYVQEVDSAAFVMMNYDFHLLDIGFRGDAGVRFTNTAQSSGGYAATGATVSWVTAHRSYTNVLPSFNLAADLTDDLVARIAAAKAIARPDLGSLSPGGDVSVQGANRGYSRGNPYLTPTRSNNIDFSLEYYPDKGALYSFGFFWKNIPSFVQTLRQTGVIYNTLGLPDSLIAGTGALPTDPFDVTQPVNSPGGDLTGIEVNAQQPFTFLPGFWSHFGVIANVTWVDSSINYLISATSKDTVRATLIGLSKYSANGTLYYEDDDYSIRGSVAYRSGYLTTVPGRNSNDVEGTDMMLNVDMEATYNLSKSLKVSLEGLNLLNDAQYTYVGSSKLRGNSYFVYGRQFFVGVRYSY